MTILKLQQSTARYEFSDGIRDFQTAFWILVTGFYALIVWGMPGSSLNFVAFARSQGILFILVTTFILPIGIPLLVSHFGLRAINEYVRRRWLWRNTGFIKAKSWVLPRSVLFGAYAICFGVWVGGILLAIQSNEARFILMGIYVGTGLAFCYMNGWVGQRMSIPRYTVVAIVGLIGTLMITLSPFNVGMFPFVMSLFWGLLLIASGIYGVMQVAKQQTEVEDAE